MPGFRPLSRTTSTQAPGARPAEPVRNVLDEVPISELIRKNFGLKPSKGGPDKEGSGDENDELVGDTNFDSISPDFFNTFQAFDDEEMRAEGFENTNQYQKAEFNEPAPRRFGSRTKKSTPRWKTDETDLFYRVLSMCGTDFSMVSKFFPHRTRKMIVNKFHCEEEKNRQRIQHALTHPEPLDLGLYAATVGIDEGSIVEDYKKNKDKMRPQADIPAQPNPRRRAKDEVEEEEASEHSEWEDVDSDREQVTGANEKNTSDDAGGDDEIDGDLDF